MSGELWRSSFGNKHVMSVTSGSGKSGEHILSTWGRDPQLFDL